MSYTIPPAVRALLDQATDFAPGRSTASDGTIGDAAHASRKSDHNPNERGLVLAGDVTHDPPRFDSFYWADEIRRRCKAGVEHRPTYIISNGKIASPSSGWEWVDYDGDPHTNHFHISVDEAHAYDDSPWYVTQGELSVSDIKEITRLLKEINEKTPGLKQQERDRNRWKAVGRMVRAIQEGRPVDDEILGAIEAD